MERRAPLVGINDVGSRRNNLHGCVNDALNLKALRIEHGWPEDNKRVLRDRDATKANVIAGLRALAEATRPEDEGPSSGSRATARASPTTTGTSRTDSTKRSAAPTA